MVNWVGKIMMAHAVLASWTIAIRVMVLLLIIKLGAAILPSISMPKPPRNVRVVGNLEFAFGVCLAGPSMLIVIAMPGTALGWRLMLIWIALLALGLTWDFLAIQVLMGKPWARRACVLVSLIRILALISLPFSTEDLFLYCIRAISMIGIPISLISLYVLCLNDTARSFFQGR